MLTTIDLDEDLLFKANEVENKAPKGYLPTKFEQRESPMA